MSVQGTITSSGDTNEQFNKFHKIVLECINKHCPIRTRFVKWNRFRKEPWLTSGLLISCNKQKKLYQNSISANSNPKLVEKYKIYWNTFKKLKRISKIKHYKNKCTEFKKDVQKLWNSINSCIGKTNDKTTIINHICIESIEIFDSKRISNEFGKYFSTIGNEYSNRIKPPNKCIGSYLNVIPKNTDSIFLAPTTSVEIRSLILKLPNKKSSGFDNIDNIILKEIKDCVSTKLAEIFNLSMLKGVFPEKMKLAEVLPLYKSKEKFLMNNYRPISLLITLSKLLEKVIYKCTYLFLQKTNQLYDSQYGFRQGHLCENAISELVGEILKNKENNKFTVSLFLDLSKAFDSLKHSTLLKKMEIYGIRGNAHAWYSSYLHKRQLRAKCMTGTGNSEVSQNFDITYGTPQGSCLGPLLFIIFCNDLKLHLTYLSCIQFADDSTLYASGKTLRLIECEINHDLEIISDWFCANKLTLNVTKTVCMVFSPKKGHDPKIKVKLCDQ